MDENSVQPIITASMHVRSNRSCFILHDSSPLPSLFSSFDFLFSPKTNSPHQIMNNQSGFGFSPPSNQDIATHLASSSSNPVDEQPSPSKKHTQLSRIDFGLKISTPRSVSKSRSGKKPDPGLPKITRPCSECGKKFPSWKALFGHMRCHPERQWRGMKPPPHLSRRVPSMSPLACDLESLMTEEEHEVAQSLLLLADGCVSIVPRFDVSNQGLQQCDNALGGIVTLGVDANNSRFECSSCKKVFPSHQALGGHRATHKNVKGCFAMTRRIDGELPDQDPNPDDCDGRKVPLLGNHQCSICYKVFSSGQALGGHMRCHWERDEEVQSAPNVDTSIPREVYELDLNMPASVEEDILLSGSADPELDLRLGL